MKKTKQLLAIALMCFIIAPVLNSCKKGDEDPFLSLKSRKGRLAGEWTLDSGTLTYTWGTTAYTATFTSSMVTASYAGESYNWMYTERIEFKKDNTFKITVMDDGDLETSEGFWTFMEGYDDVAKRECVVVRITQRQSGGSVVTYSGESMPTDIYRLIRLSNDDMIVDFEGQRMGSEVEMTTGNLTYAKK